MGRFLVALMGMFLTNKRFVVVPMGRLLMTLMVRGERTESIVKRARTDRMNTLRGKGKKK